MWGSDAEGPSLPMAAGRGCCRQSSFLGEARAGIWGWEGSILICSFLKVLGPGLLP